jgi:hypothetical protein
VPTEPSMALQVTVALQGSPLCLFSTLYPRSDPCSRRGTAVSRVSPRETHLSLLPLSCRLVSENRAGATARTTATTVTKRYRPSRAPFWSCARRAAHAGLCCGGLPCNAEPTCRQADACTEPPHAIPLQPVQYLHSSPRGPSHSQTAACAQALQALHANPKSVNARFEQLMCQVCCRPGA